MYGATAIDGNNNGCVLHPSATPTKVHLSSYVHKGPYWTNLRMEGSETRLGYSTAEASFRQAITQPTSQATRRPRSAMLQRPERVSPCVALNDLLLRTLHSTHLPRNLQESKQLLDLTHTRPHTRKGQGASFHQRLVILGAALIRGRHMTCIQKVYYVQYCMQMDCMQNVSRICSITPPLPNVAVGIKSIKAFGTKRLPTLREMFEKPWFVPISPPAHTAHGVLD